MATMLGMRPGVIAVLLRIRSTLSPSRSDSTCPVLSPGELNLKKNIKKDMGKF